MAEIIQGQLNIVHSMEQGTPTEPNEKPTDILQDETLDDNTPNTTNNKFQSKVTSAAVKRRALNMGVSIWMDSYNLYMDDKLFKETLYGDKRGMAKIQSSVSNNKALVSQGMTWVGAAITTAALNNPLIMGLQIFYQSHQIANRMQQRELEQSHFLERTSVELYENKKRQDRLIIGTYNRR